ncbi:MAG TPA: hypothetical protein VJU87_04050, partial [Gemmatimonadaceae bacterium]|nr:hypothetical protein [Gemmatimonadaceae bacterium]
MALLLRWVGWVALLAAAPACGQSPGSAAAGEVGTPGDHRALAKAIASDTALAAARRALQDGHPWTATRLLTPLLNTPSRRTPAALLLAARAAAGWDGWPEVIRLIGAEPWVDSSFGGFGRELLARSALERGDSTAAVQARAAVQSASDRETRAVRTVLLARALDRQN